jgi:hypothetical protein
MVPVEVKVAGYPAQYKPEAERELRPQVDNKGMGMDMNMGKDTNNMGKDIHTDMRKETQSKTLNRSCYSHHTHGSYGHGSYGHGSYGHGSYGHGHRRRNPSFLGLAQLELTHL